MSYRIGIDIGGTFTDCVVWQENAEPRIFKVPSTPGAFERGFMDALDFTAHALGVTLAELLADVETFVHGTTVSTNALVEGKTGRVGLIVTRGHPDILLLREGPRKRSFDWSVDYPEPFVPRRLTHEVGGRIDSRGLELAPLEERDVAEAVRRFRTLGVDAIAVSLLWSIANGSHETRVRELIRAAWPEVAITLSHELNPIPREYRRTISAAINAALHPVVGQYLAALTRALADAGYRRELMIANSVGGMMPPDEIAARPIFSLMSGPTLAPVAARSVTGENDVIVVDMGGTTFDVSAIRDGKIVISHEATFGKDILGIPKVDVRSIGAGGGSVASLDAGGLLRVGPRSAGAVPGPACYGRGGTEATVTDANVLLGIINPDYFLGGRIRLDRGAAERAIVPIADRLGISLVEAAYAVHTTSNHNMVAAIEDITVNEGIDPRESFLVSGGGATPAHLGEIAVILGMRRFLVPRMSSALSAFGGLVAEVRFDEMETLLMPADGADVPRINALLERLKQRVASFLRRAGVPAGQQGFSYSVLGRYQFQSWEIEVPFEVRGDTLDGAAIVELGRIFHRTHERIYSIKDEAEAVEFVTWKVSGHGKPPVALWPRYSTHGSAAAPTPYERRPVYEPRRRALFETMVFRGDALAPGAQIGGPAVVEQETTTLYVPTNGHLTVTGAGDYLVEILH